MDWNQANRIGWTVERYLRFAVIMACAMALVFSVYVSLWRALDAETRREALCGQIAAAEAQSGSIAFSASDDDATRALASECELHRVRLAKSPVSPK